jgi:putative glycosyltransferase (TIGR04372 family)
MSLLKLRQLLSGFIRGYILAPIKFIICLPFLPAVIIIYLIRPFFLIRVGCLNTRRIGHFAGNTELYCCEMDAGINKPKTKFVDLFFVNDTVCNKQLLLMWKRELRFLPSIILSPVYYWSFFIPQGHLHRTGEPSQHDRDIFNLMDIYPPHLHFTEEEEKKGIKLLAELGIVEGEKFICLNVRDSAYLPDPRFNYHSFRDCNIENYLFTAKKLTNFGFKVVRMGAKVHQELNSDNPNIIDYATNGKRSDFMDIYLGAKCYFTISTSTGWDNIPYIFRRPIVYAPFTPIGFFFTFSSKYLAIPKHYFFKKENRTLTLEEVFKSDLAYTLTTSEYEEAGIELHEPTQEEIWEVVYEMLLNCENNFTQLDNNAIGKKAMNHYVQFQKIGQNGNILHGELKAKLGDKFLN